MPDNPDLRRNVSRARKQDMYFAYVFGGDNNQLLLDKKKIKASTAKELKSKVPGGKLVSGTCAFKDGELHLNIEKGRAPASLGREMRANIKDETGFSWKIAVQDGEEEEAEADNEGDDDNG
jgi:hypothetical protein